MKRNTLVNYILLGSLLVGLYGCSKSSSTTPNQQTSGVCKISDIGLTTEFELWDNPATAYVTYNAANYIDEINLESYKFKNQYSGINVIKRDYFDNSKTVYSDSIFYNANGDVSLIRAFKGNSRADSNILVYGAQGLSKIDFYHQDQAHSGPLYHAYDLFNYTSNSSKVMRYDSDGKLYDECTYTYGTNANKLKTGIKNLSLLLQNNAYINGRAMQDILYYGLFYNDYLPTVLNYKNYDGETPSGVYNLTYTFNANGYPVQININATTIMSFGYNCN